jgi:hypothetical protein
MLWRKPRRNIAKVGVEGSNPFARSRQTLAKHSPSNFGPRKRLGSGRFCASGLGFVDRNDTENLSLNGRLSPELGGWPIYSTSFFLSIFNVIKFTRSREVAVPCAPPNHSSNLRFGPRLRISIGQWDP